jgi:hypothetical protein
MKNKQNLILLLILIAVSLAYYFFVYKKGDSTLDPDEVGFAVPDTAAIQSIRFVRKSGDVKQAELMLTRDGNTWRVNDKYPAVQAKVDILLQTLKLIEVREPILEQAKQNMLSLLKQENTEVEIRMQDNTVKRYFVGTHTPDHKGTFMLLQGADNMYVTYIPGFTGYLNSRYSSLEDDWRELLLFAANPETVESVSVQYREGQGSFRLHRGSKSADWAFEGLKDSTGIDAYIRGFGKIIAESRAEKYYPGKKEELSAQAADVVFSIKNFGAPVYTLKLWYRTDKPDFYFGLPQSVDAELYNLQQFHFGKYLIISQ